MYQLARRVGGSEGRCEIEGLPGEGGRDRSLIPAVKASLGTG